MRAAPTPPWIEEWARRLERIRIRRHLRSVEGELRAKPVGHLSAEQRRLRATNLDRLHEYWSAGRFPANTIDAEHRIPIFVDASGTRCAVAYLLDRSGESDLVSAVAQDNNLVRIPDVVDGPLLSWLEREGLTREEAARIQPSYSPELDFQIFTTVLFAAFLPLKILGEVLLRRISRHQTTPKREVQIGVTIAFVLASFGIALGSAIVLQPTTVPYATTYRTALILGFLVTLLPLELAALWALRSQPTSGLNRRGASAYIGLLNVAASALLASFTVPFFAAMLR